MTTFSVIVPLYNGEKYIKECLDSILAQTYPQFEIVVINDGSTDDSAKVVEAYKDERVKLYSQENKGLFHARLSGLSQAQNDFCLYVDADDLIAENLLETLAKEFEEGAECVVYDLQPFQDGETPVKQDGEVEKTVWEGEQAKEPLRLLLQGKTIQSIVCKAFAKKLVDIEKLEKYPRVAVGEDALHTLEVYSNTQKTVFLGEKFYFYRQHGASMTHKLKISSYFDNVYKFAKYREIGEEVFGKEETERLFFDLPKRYFKMVFAFMLNPRYVATKEEYAEFVRTVAEDETFRWYLQWSHTCPWYYRVLIRLIKKQRLGLLRILRSLVKLVK